MRKLRSAWELIKARLRLRGAEQRRRIFDEGVSHERRRVLHLLDTIEDVQAPARWSVGGIGHALAYVDGWDEARDRMMQLVHQRTQYDGPPESIGHIGLTMPDGG
jgi:hypothetical protein